MPVASAENIAHHPALEGQRWLLRLLSRPFNEALSLDPTDAAVWNTMIDLLKQLGRGAEAREAEYERDLALRQS